uniref:XRE family transcriptional regulator n=1 Tax=Escherichia coli TaxID=562 RepID=UPI00132FC686
KTPKKIKKLSLKAGITQKQCSHIYGVGLKKKKKKEEVNTQNSQSLSLVEFEFLLLLAGEHPEYVLCKRESK